MNRHLKYIAVLSIIEDDYQIEDMDECFGFALRGELDAVEEDDRTFIEI